MRALDDIVALTETVERHVERGEWAEAGALDAERCRLLAALFADPRAAPEIAAHRKVLEDLLLRNQQTLRQVSTQRERLADQGAALGRAGGAVRAYERNTGNANLVYLRDVRVNQR